MSKQLYKGIKGIPLNKRVKLSDSSKRERLHEGFQVELKD